MGRIIKKKQITTENSDKKGRLDLVLRFENSFCQSPSQADFGRQISKSTEVNGNTLFNFSGLHITPSDNLTHTAYCISFE